MPEVKLERALKWIVAILNRHEVPFQITGGFAAHLYGSKRPVNDIDIDIPEDMMERLLPDIQPYIVFGPARFLDERWDLKLITLNYEGQEIDIGGAFETKICDNRNQKWKQCPAKLKKTVTHQIFGLNLPVIPPQALIDYKKMLSGDPQKVDIAAVETYMNHPT